MAKKTTPAAVWVDIEDLIPWDRNPRHNEDAAWVVARSVESSGFGNPILAQESSRRIIAGHTRRKAALLLRNFTWNDEQQAWVDRPEDEPWQVPGAPGPGMVPVRFLDLDDEAATRLALTDNKTGEIAGWDEEALKTLILELGTDSGEPIIGWSDDELAAMFDGLEPDPEIEPRKKKVEFEVKTKDPSKAKVSIACEASDAEKIAGLVRTALEAEGLAFALDVE